MTQRLCIKVFAVLLCLLGTFNNARACEVCGCAAVGMGQGILPQMGTNFVGFRLRTSEFKSHLLHSPVFRTSEYFTSTEFWARYIVNEKLQTFLSVPYSYNTQQTTSQKLITQGLADISLSALYKIWDNTPNQTDSTCTQVEWEQSAFLGGGLKIPTGRFRYNQLSNSEVANANFQTGTGSTDFLISAMYSVHNQTTGAMLDVQAKLPTTNPNNYKFGNRLTTSLIGFTSLNISNSFRSMFLWGTNAEFSSRDLDNQKTVSETGGSALFATLGTDTYIASTICISIHAFIPLTHNLAGGEIRPLNRYTYSISLLW